MCIIDCRVIWCEDKKILQRDQEAILFTHSDYKEENGLLFQTYDCKQYYKILQEVPTGQFFIDGLNDDDDENMNQDQDQGEEVELPEAKASSLMITTQYWSRRILLMQLPRYPVSMKDILTLMKCCKSGNMMLYVSEKQHKLGTTKHFSKSTIQMR